MLCVIHVSQRIDTHEMGDDKSFRNLRSISVIEGRQAVLHNVVVLMHVGPGDSFDRYYLFKLLGEDLLSPVVANQVDASFVRHLQRDIVSGDLVKVSVRKQVRFELKSEKK